MKSNPIFDNLGFGTYILVLSLNKARAISIGRLGKLKFKSGYYLYVGSAFGPGGLSARLAHHLKTSLNPHWHIDYFKSTLKIQEIWYSTEAKSHEHFWADFIQMTDDFYPVKGFGASDCKCESHLFYTSSMPSYEKFVAQLGKDICCLRLGFK